MGKIISNLLERESPQNVTIIEGLSDVSRLIVDTLHDEVSARRGLLLSYVSNPSIKETLNSTTADTFLFGQKLADDLKNVNIIDQSAEKFKAKKTPFKPMTKKLSGPASSSVQCSIQPVERAKAEEYPSSMESEIEGTGEETAAERQDPAQETLLEEKINDSVSCIAGRLSSFYERWKIITSNPKILSIVKGYKIFFKSTPVQRYICNNNFSITENNRIANLINDLIGKGVIERCKSIEGQILSKIFTVAKSDNTHRLILNLKHLNEFIVTTHFKMEDYRTASKLIDKSSYMATSKGAAAPCLASIRNEVTDE